MANMVNYLVSRNLCDLKPNFVVVYLDYGTNNKINLDIYMMTDMGQNWDIMVTMIKCDSLERGKEIGNKL